MTDYLHRTIDFLYEIGIEAVSDLDAMGFVDHVLIKDGKLHYHPGLALPSNVLHEAGHLAVMPARFRPLAQRDMDDVFALMLDDYGERMESNPAFDPEAPENRACMQASETEATAWAFAAGRHLGIPDEMIILDEEYEGEGADVRCGLQCNAYLGINGLVAGGMCQSLRAYPTLTRWLQN